jgi:predicted RNase H-like HicB family nuclease
MAAPRKTASRKTSTGPKIVFKRSGSWWAVSMPAMPGAFSQGRTKGEALENLWDAVGELAKAQADRQRAARRSKARHGAATATAA